MSTPSETAPADQDALPTEQRTAAVVYNPVKVHLPTLKRTVQEHQQQAGWAETLWFETSEEDPGGGMARAAIEAGADVVAAAGGDGTVRAVAEVVHESGSTLALLPSGTGNLLARNMKLPSTTWPRASGRSSTATTARSTSACSRSSVPVASANASASW